MVFKKKTSYYLLLILFLNSCFGQEKKEVRMDKETQEAYEKFKKQEHRLAFNSCAFSYNEIEVSLDKGINSLIQVLGKYDRNVQGRTGTLYTWTDIGITILLLNEKNKSLVNLGHININFEESYLDDEIFDDEEDNIKNIELRKRNPINNNYVLINGFPLTKNQNMGEFVKNIGLSMDNFSINDYDGYDLVYENCDEKKKIHYYFTSEVKYENKGSGHLNFKGKGIFGKGTIRSLQISIRDYD